MGESFEEVWSRLVPITFGPWPSQESKAVVASPNDEVDVSHPNRLLDQKASIPGSHMLNKRPATARTIAPP